MISVDLAVRLTESGVEWKPEDGDRFFIPDRDLDDRVFSISEMTVGVRNVRGGPQISFNGAVEWAIDAIMAAEVLWLPTEAQLRSLLGDRFVGLHQVDHGFRCEAIVRGSVGAFDAAEAADAYGLALLAVRSEDGA